ncbi:hypothetical protein ACFYOW_45705 [Nocardia sp. NPDC006982]|uniref:hypothetical protein n=1 Tax=Nocardia sp. NPDC006982 TaxID=3364307 RepID=UPI0036CDC1D2
MGSRLVRALQAGSFIANWWYTQTREQRSAMESALRIDNEQNLLAAKLGSIAARDKQGLEKHELDQHATRRTIERADEDIERRRAESANDNSRKQEAHSAHMGNSFLRGQLTRLEAAIKVADFQRRTQDSEAENDRKDDESAARVEAAQAQKAMYEKETSVKGEDLERRNTDSENRNTRDNEAHAWRRTNATNREQRETELHNKRMEEIQQRIDHGKRTMGFSETLTDQQQNYDAAMGAAAGFGAAVGTADLNPEQQAAADAWKARYGEDTGQDPEVLIEEAVRRAAADAPLDGEASDGVEDLAARLAADAVESDVIGEDTAPPSGPDTGEQIGAAIKDAAASFDGGSEGHAPVSDTEPATAVAPDAGPDVAG